jgi:hypothetical protein
MLQSCLIWIWNLHNSIQLNEYILFLVENINGKQSKFLNVNDFIIIIIIK